MSLNSVKPIKRIGGDQTWFLSLLASFRLSSLYPPSCSFNPLIEGRSLSDDRKILFWLCHYLTSHYQDCDRQCNHHQTIFTHWPLRTDSGAVDWVPGMGGLTLYCFRITRIYITTRKSHYTIIIQPLLESPLLSRSGKAWQSTNTGR